MQKAQNNRNIYAGLKGFFASLNFRQSQSYETLVAGVNKKIPLANGRYIKAINLDNAATTPPLKSVLREIKQFSPWYSSIHRGKGYKSVVSSDAYEKGREIVKKFVNADKKMDIVVFTKNSTEAINLLAHILSQGKKGQVVLSTEMEHLANDLPWRDKFIVDYVRVDLNGCLSIGDLERKLIQYKGRVKLVTVTGASNVTGYINPIHSIAVLAHRYGAQIHVDGSQLVPHKRVDVKPFGSAEHIDYLTFTGHKMYAPFGVGALIGPQNIFQEAEPLLKGGGTVKLVSTHFVELDDAPSRAEAGTPNIMGVVALTAAIRTLEGLSLEMIHNYEKTLIDYTIDGLKQIPGIEIYGDNKQDEERVSLVCFNLKGMNHHGLAQLLSDEYGIAVRSGLFCAHPYIQKLLNLSNDEIESFRQNQDVPIPGLVRVSIGLYNQKAEIDKLLEALRNVAKNINSFKWYNDLAQFGPCGSRKN